MAGKLIGSGDRERMWREALDARTEERRGRIAILGVFVLAEIGGVVDLYNGHDDEFQRTFALLDSAGLLAGLLEPYLSVQSGETNRLIEEDFLALVTARLARIARNPDAPDDAGELFRFWRNRLYDRQAREPDSLTIAETAALFGISPQAVYKWIERGKVEAFEGPDGRKRIHSASLRTDRDREREIDVARRELRENAKEGNFQFTGDTLAQIET